MKFKLGLLAFTVAIMALFFPAPLTSILQCSVFSVQCSVLLPAAIFGVVCFVLLRPQRVSLRALGLLALCGIAIGWATGSHAAAVGCLGAAAAALTEDQVAEFKQLMEGFKGYGNLLKEVSELAKMEGGLASIKELPGRLKDAIEGSKLLEGEVKKLRKASLNVSQAGVRWIGNVPFVTDECAKSLTSVFVLECGRMKDGQALRQLCPNEGNRERILALAAENLGLEVKTAMTTTEIPVPTIFVPQIIELVYLWGQARQFATVFPLGAGDVRLPRLKAGEDDFAFTGVGTAGMSQTVNEKRVAAENVTFTANKFGGIVRIPTELEEDTFIPLGQFLARYIARQMAKGEDKALFIGDGTATYANIAGIGKYCDTNSTYRIQLEAGKTNPSDALLDDFRNLRALVSAQVLAGGTGAYYLHPSWEPRLRSFNKYPNFIVFETNGGKAMFDGWPVRWIGGSQAFQTTAAASAYLTFFGDLSYWYLGTRGSIRLEISREVYFATDELAMRALERFDVEAMAIDAMATLKTAAA